MKTPFSEVPKFRFHPSPFSSGALQDSEDTCECCGESRGYIYDGPIYSVEEVESVCPWCIADGTAHAKWEASFTDAFFVDEYGEHVDLPLDLTEEVLHRTPGVVGAVQSVFWWVHCGEPAEFLRVDGEHVCFRCGKCSKTHEYHDFD